MAALRVDLGRVRRLPAKFVPGKLNHGALHAVAEAEVRNFVLADIVDGRDLALNPARTKAARDNYGV